jgi:putative PIN family toxin of toxin-antitoxin system
MIQKRIVIDTNVCLDLFVFRDPRWIPLLDALRSGELEAVTRDDCRTEWLMVLQYPHLPLDEQSRPGAISAFDNLIACLLPHDMPGRNDVRLPVCTDRDDQKFLELARDSSAAILITKDKALLKLAKRTAKAGMFHIMTPEKWIASWGSVQTTLTAHG